MSFSSRNSHSAGSSSSGDFRKRGRPNSNSNSRSRNPRNILRSKNSPFTDFGSYMAEKNRKLRDQFETDASTSSTGPGDDGKGIFDGVSIFVDGFTIPSSQELKGYMLKHGGRFVNYFSRHTVTHIICNNLPDSKMKNLRAFSRGLPVVKPAWVVDSVAASRLLSWVPYGLSEYVNETCKQQKLYSFFYQKSNPSLGHVEMAVTPDPDSDNEGSFSTDKASRQSVSSEQSQKITYEGESSEEFACFEDRSTDQRKTTASKDTDSQDEQNVLDASESSCRSIHSISNPNSKEALDIKSTKDSNQGHSTLTDPNFVENYFKNSRLHFIGTWRNRYRKRFSNILGEAKNNSSDSDPRTDRKKVTIIHIDMDCFFVSVIVRNFPELLDKPVAVCHSDNPKGTAEISSANYPARDYGVKAGMFVRDAKSRCPHLVIFPYDFEAYEEVADQFYTVLHKHCNRVQALSCDEAFLDITGHSNDDPEHLALMIREEITQTTRCTASAGIAENLLLARLATRSAKPNGQCFIPSEKVHDYLSNLPIKALPGIGHTLAEKLKYRQVQTCGQLRMISKEALHNDFGKKIGDMLWNYCRGIDHRLVEVVQEAKSVGAEVNWGVRFNNSSDSENFLMNLCKEVSLRLQGCGVQGHTITLKVKKRRKGAEEPVKYMGCGDCETVSRSVTIPVATDDVMSLQRIAKQIFVSFHIDVKEVRGVGLKVSRLESVGTTRKENLLEAWLASPSSKSKEAHKDIASSSKQNDSGDAGDILLADWRLHRADSDNQQNDRKSTISCNNEISCPANANLGNSCADADSISQLPPLGHLDLEVVKNLPPEIISEINAMYKGELHGFMEMHQEEKGRINSCKSAISLPEKNVKHPAPVYPEKGYDTKEHIINESIDRKRGKYSVGSVVPLAEQTTESKVVCPEENVPGNCNGTNAYTQYECANPGNSEFMERTPYLIKAAFASSSRSDCSTSKSRNADEQIGLMPSSLSQADISVLQQLPHDVRADVLGLVPPHRKKDFIGNALRCTSARKFLKAEGSETAEYSRTFLLSGSPPNWVEKFRTSNCMILNIFAELYAKCRGDDLLSSIFQSMVSFLPLTPVPDTEEWDEALSYFSELLTQYTNLKIESDIEELYNCFCLLKRYSAVSKLFLQIHDIMLPFLQASIDGHYSGNLHLPVF
ncbi:DNA repair protein REV1 isoform X2 [Typha angustifolia]|uniref:DNA repair protein REV1 isoform X2 n=1 Tax=Typha angustifolia TaxID=59011 RepID=UPI003C30D6FC